MICRDFGDKLFVSRRCKLPVLFRCSYFCFSAGLIRGGRTCLQNGIIMALFRKYVVSGLALIQIPAGILSEWQVQCPNLLSRGH